MNAPANKPYGLMAQFSDPEDLLGATRRAYADGYRRMDAYSKRFTTASRPHQLIAQLACARTTGLA